MIDESKPALKQSSSDNLPWLLAAFLVALLTFTGWHFYRSIQALLDFQTLSSLGLVVSPLYLAGNGLVWGAAGAFLSWVIWKRKPWSPTAGTLLSFLYMIYFWADRMLFAQPDVLIRRWPVNLVLTILGLGGALITLNHSSSRRYFQKNPAKIP